MQSLLNSSYAPVMYESAQSLLTICSLSKTFGDLNFAGLGSWALLAFDTLMRLWLGDSKGASVSTRTQLLEIMASGLQFLPVSPPSHSNRVCFSPLDLHCALVPRIWKDLSSM